MVKKYLYISVAIAIALIFVLHFITFTIRYDECAVVTTFGKAADAQQLNIDGTEAGLYFKWPWPVQQVIRYDRRLQVLEDELEQQETHDRQVVIVKVYALYQITGPLAFYRSFATPEEAEIFLKNRLRTAKAEISKFKFSELTHDNPDSLKLDQVKELLLARVSNDLSGHDGGITLQSVGINRVMLPGKISRTVFSRMKQTRQRMAQNARSEGKASAQSITAKTDSERDRIIAFAERLAQTIRAEGDAAAARYYKEYSKNQEFALFLRKLESLKKTLSSNTTFILDTESEPFDLLDQ